MREEREIKKDGSRPVKNSGRGIRKGDAVLYDLLIDYKDYTNSFSLSRQNWQKHAQDAWNDGEYTPAIVVTLNAKEEKTPKDRPIKVGILPWERIVQLLKAEQELEERNS